MQCADVSSLVSFGMKCRHKQQLVRHAALKKLVDAFSPLSHKPSVALLSRKEVGGIILFIKKYFIYS